LDRPTQTAFDTETFRGKLKVICSPDAFFEPTGKVEDLLGWMVDHGSDTCWTYNLRFDSDVVLRAIFEAIDIQHDLKAKAEFIEKHAVKIGDFKVTLIGAKNFKIERKSDAGRQVLSCFDVSAFFTEGERRVTLDYAALKMLGEGKSNEELGIDRKSIGTIEGYYEEHRDKIIEYCKQDAKLTLKLGEYLVDVARDAVGVYPKRWSSAASMSKAWIELHHPEILRRDKKKDRTFRFSFRGGIFVTRVLGRVPGETEADITNAYGFALSQLASLNGLIERSGTERSSDAVYGSYWIAISYDGRLPWRLGDLGIRVVGQSEKVDDAKNPDKKVLYPLSEEGETHSYCATRSELDYFDEEGIPYKLLWADELCGTPLGPAFPDLPVLLQKVVALKKAAKVDPKANLLRECLKRVVNSCYGALSESRHGETAITTWPLAAAITASCRVTIWRQWRKIERGNGTVTSVNTDSLRYVPVDYRVPVTPGVLGAFEDKFVGHTVTHYQSGVAMIEHPPKCGCQDEPLLDRLLRADDGLGSPTPYPEETPRQARDRLRRPPAPHEQGGLELHSSACPCSRCVKAPRVALRKRGMPTLNPAHLLTATGTEVEVVSLRPIHAIEGLIQDRMDDVADIPDGEESIDADDGTRRRKLSVLSNLVTAVYDPKDLTFPRLNRGAVFGSPIPMNAMMNRDWIKQAVKTRQTIEEAAA